MSPVTSRAASAYRTIGIDTRAEEHDQHQLVSMMFETTVECLVVARGAMAKGDVALRVKKLNQAMRILSEGLRASLDMERGGEIAQNLDNLYEYCLLQIAKANASNDPAILEEVGGLIKTVADGWSHMRDGKAPPSASANAQKPDQDIKSSAANLVNRVASYGPAGMTQRAVFA